MSPKEPSTESLTNIEIVTYAVALLGGLDRPVHLERVAVRAHKLAPGAFRWDLDEYAAYIDKDKIRVSLTDAEKVAKGALVKGVGATRGGRTKRTDLWRLTAAGNSWVADHRKPIESATGQALPSMKRRRAQDLRHRIMGSDLFRKYESDGAVEYRPFDFADLLECSPDASNNVVHDRFDSLRGQTALLGVPQLLGFLDACADAHRRMLEV